MKESAYPPSTDGESSQQASALPTDSALECRVVDETLERKLAQFFNALKTSGDDAHFHPHPFTDEEAKRRAQYSGRDLYLALVDRDRVIGYGMLRGLDEGYEIPSLGIAIHPSERGTGLGKLLMHFLHIAARRRGASRIRLKVHAENTIGIQLYEQLGYTFQGEEGGQLIGYLEL